MSVNKAMLIGRLGHDPEMKEVGSTQKTTFSLATNRRWNDKDGNKQEEVCWHNIVSWGKQAETLKKYLVKGSQVFIEGRISNRSYDGKDGTKKYISEVVVENFRFLDTKAASEDTKPEPSGGEEMPF